MRFLKPILYLSLSLTALSFAAGFWMLATEAASTLHHASLAADALAEAPALLAARVTALQASVEKLPNQVLPPVLARVDQATAKADAQLTALRTETLATIKDSLEVADGRLASIQDDLQPVFAGSTHLMDTYAALPGQLGTELRPSWLALQPEITCRQADGSGYGGCWHSRVTGIMGEAVKVGGTFTQEFPKFAGSINGMAGDARAWTGKYVYPRPMTRKEKVAVTGKVILGFGMAGLRGGIF